MASEGPARRPASASSSSRASSRRGSAKRVSDEAVVINVSNCKYEVVRSAARGVGWKVEEDEDEYDAMVADATASSALAAPAARTAQQQAVILRHHHTYARSRTREPWNVYWTDTSVSSQRAMRLERFQRLNHFPGMYHLARKGGLGKHLTQLAKLFPTDFYFFPQTWVLPQQWSEFKERIDSGKGNRTFIIKPDASCQGKGIFLTRTHENVNPAESQVAQRYLHKPLLIDGFKFDMRIYVIVTSVDPLRIFLFEDGLVRICTQKYVEPRGRNLQKSCMHLTNYAINKESDNFVFNKASSDPGTGNKRSLQWFWGWLSENHGSESTAAFQAEMHDMIIKSLISVLPQLEHTYRSCVKHPGPSNCFEILGFDVLMDRKFKPWLIEVNHSPSFACDTPLDADIKSRLITKTMALIGVHASDKRKTRQRLKKDAQSRLYSGTVARRKPSSPQADQAQHKPGGASSSSSSSSGSGSASALLRKRERLEDRQCEDGALTRIYPPADADKLSYYEPYIAAASRLFGRASGAAQAGRPQGGSSSSQARPLSARAKLLRKAQACGVPVGGSEPQQQASERRLEDTALTSTGAPRRKPAPTSRAPSKRISEDLERYRFMGLQRKSAFNAYLRPSARQVLPAQTRTLVLDVCE